MSTAPTRIGIVGTGAIARMHIEAALSSADDVVITAICDPNPAALAATSTLLPDAKLFTSLPDLLGSGDIDAGIVATPHFLHASQALAFAAAGVPVLVEKPLVTSLDELRALRDAAGESDTLVIAGQMHRFDRPNVLARRWIDADSGRFGELTSFSLFCWQDITQYTASVGLTHWLLDGALAGGGVVVSLAIHQLDVVRYLGGQDYAEVSARGVFAAPFHNGAEASASVLVTMGNGAAGTMFADYQAPRAFAGESISIFGDKGGLGSQNRALGSYLGPLVYAPAHEIDPVLDFTALAQDATAPEAALIADLVENRFANQLIHFARAVRGEVLPINTVAENFNSVACIDAINRSIREEGVSVTVATQ